MNSNLKLCNKCGFNIIYCIMYFQNDLDDNSYPDTFSFYSEPRVSTPTKAVLPNCELSIPVNVRKKKVESDKPYFCSF